VKVAVNVERDVSLDHVARGGHAGQCPVLPLNLEFKRCRNSLSHEDAAFHVFAPVSHLSLRARMLVGIHAVRYHGSIRPDAPYREILLPFEWMSR
jgi:hypothetical protein